MGEWCEVVEASADVNISFLNQKLCRLSQAAARASTTCSLRDQHLEKS